MKTWRGGGAFTDLPFSTSWWRRVRDEVGAASTPAQNHRDPDQHRFRLQPRHIADDAHLHGNPAEKYRSGGKGEESGVAGVGKHGDGCRETASADDEKQNQAGNEVVVERTAVEPLSGNGLCPHEAVYSAAEGAEGFEDEEDTEGITWS